MKVSELQERLRGFDPGLDVLCYTEDARFVAAGAGFTLLQIQNVEVMHGERKRLALR